MSEFVVDHRPVVGLGLVVGSTWLLVTALIWFCRGPLARSLAIRRAKIQLANDIDQMTPVERKIIGCLLARNQRMFTNTDDGGHANTLIAKRIVVRARAPGLVFTALDVPFEIPELAWAILMERKSEFPYTASNTDEVEPDPWRVHWMAR